MFLILKSENKEVFEELLKYLDKKGWTFGSGKPIKDYKDTIFDFYPYIILYEDKTIRITSSLDYYDLKAVPTIAVIDVPIVDIPFEYDKWIEEVKRAVMKEYMRGTKISL